MWVLSPRRVTLSSCWWCHQAARAVAPGHHARVCAHCGALGSPRECHWNMSFWRAGDPFPWQCAEKARDAGTSCQTPWPGQACHSGSGRSPSLSGESREGGLCSACKEFAVCSAACHQQTQAPKEEYLHFPYLTPEDLGVHPSTVGPQHPF